MDKIEEIKAACNTPSKLLIKVTEPNGRSVIFETGPDYDAMFHEWLTNGANEHPKEWWVRYWRTGPITYADIVEQNTFVMGFMESLWQSPDWPAWFGFPIEMFAKRFTIQVIANPSGS